jgi:hypothetical protein
LHYAANFPLISRVSAARNQPEFSFDNDDPSDGLSLWRRQREDDLAVLARRAGLPIGQQTEVWLKGGVRLRGVMRLYEEKLFIEGEQINHLKLTVDGVAFTQSDLESCVRLD